MLWRQVQPTNPFKAGYHNASAASWGGNVMFEAGRYHLFVTQISQVCGLEKYGSNSEIARAESADPAGPFAFKQVVRAPFAHNPTIRRLPKGGGFVIFFIGGNVVPLDKQADCTKNITPPTRPRHALATIHAIQADSILGPWTEPVPIEFTDGGSNTSIWTGGGSNPSPVINLDGSVVLALRREFRAAPSGTAGNKELLGVAQASSWRGPYTMITDRPVPPERPGCIKGMGEECVASYPPLLQYCQPCVQRFPV